jgi:hypothetical protein
MRRVAAVVAVLVGITLIAFTFTEHLFSRSADAQTISNHYKPLMSSEGLADLSRLSARRNAVVAPRVTEALAN